MIKVLQMPVRDAMGGITQYALRNWEFIDKTQFVFDWVTLDDELRFERDLIEQGCKVFHLSCRQEDDELRFRSEMDEILTCGYDAVHLHTSYWRGFLAEELAVKAGLPRIIVHAHSTGIDMMDDSERGRLFDVHNGWKAGFSAELATHFAACSHAAADFLFGPQIPKERITILRNAIETERFAYNTKLRADIRSRMGLSDEFVILQPGRFEYQKNHSFMLRAFFGMLEEVPGALLFLAGDGSLRGKMENKVADLQIANRVRFLGYCDDIPTVLQAADLVVMPSLFEGLSIAAIEAQCSGVWCLLSDQVSVETILSNNAVRLPLDETVWRNAIVKIAREGYERRDSSADVAAMGYSLKEQIKVLERIYAGEDG